VEGSGHALLSWQLPEGNQESHEKSVRIVDVLAEIRSGHPPNTRQKDFSLSQLARYEFSGCIKAAHFIEQLNNHQHLCNMQLIGSFRFVLSTVSRRSVFTAGHSKWIRSG
jgi:hypothetical protein